MALFEKRNWKSVYSLHQSFSRLWRLNGQSGCRLALQCNYTCLDLNSLQEMFTSLTKAYSVCCIAFVYVYTSGEAYKIRPSLPSWQPSSSLANQTDVMHRANKHPSNMFIHIPLHTQIYSHNLYASTHPHTQIYAFGLTSSASRPSSFSFGGFASSFFHIPFASAASTSGKMSSKTS